MNSTHFGIHGLEFTCGEEYQGLYLQNTSTSLANQR
jgi:hypothetical protein